MAQHHVEALAILQSRHPLGPHLPHAAPATPGVAISHRHRRRHNEFNQLAAQHLMLTAGWLVAHNPGCILTSNGKAVDDLQATNKYKLV
jgi:hypothetical protein